MGGHLRAPGARARAHGGEKKAPPPHGPLPMRPRARAEESGREEASPAELCCRSPRAFWSLLGCSTSPSRSAAEQPAVRRPWRGLRWCSGGCSGARGPHAEPTRTLACPSRHSPSAFPHRFARIRYVAPGYDQQPMGDAVGLVLFRRRCDGHAQQGQVRVHARRVLSRGARRRL
jgi:hypothetical protein